MYYFIAGLPMKRSSVFIISLLFTSLTIAERLDAAWFQAATDSSDLEQQIANIEQGLGPSIHLKGENQISWTIEERMEHHRVPGVSVAVVNEGKLCWAKGYGVANTENARLVSNETLFQAGSISKPVAALAALKLVDEGKIDLDEDVNLYLKNWKVPENELTRKEKVTLRRLLTHTGGLTVHGFPGYSQTDDLPTTIQVLDGKGNTAPIQVDTVPGTAWRYSGGGYTVIQQLVEDVSGVPFAEYLTEIILGPMGMKKSTFEQPLPRELHPFASAAYNRMGKVIDGYWHNYPEKAAAGLWTTPADLAIYCMEIQQIVAGKENGILSPRIVKEMLTQHQGDWGLGPSLDGENDELVFQHGGKNAGFSNDMFAYANRGQAVIVMTSGDNGIQLAAEIMRAIANQYGWRGQTRMLETVEMGGKQLEAFAGKYTLEMTGQTVVIQIEAIDKQLKVIIPSQRATKELTPIGDTQFVDTSDGTQVSFTKAKDGTIEGLTIDNRTKFTKSEVD